MSRDETENEEWQEIVGALVHPKRRVASARRAAERLVALVRVAPDRGGRLSIIKIAAQLASPDGLGRGWAPRGEWDMPSSAALRGLAARSR